MRFGAPWLLWGLAVVPVALVLYMAREWGRRGRASRFARPAMLANVVPRRPAWRRHVPTALYLAAAAALLIALARPEAVRAVPRERAVLLLALDTSMSMDSIDVPPSRLEAATRAAEALLETLPARFEVGLIGFDRGARVLSLPSRDRRAVRDALAGITTSLKTAIGDAILLALDVEARAAPAAVGRVPTAVVLLTDGRNTYGSDPLSAAAAARQRRVRVHTVGFGDPGRPARRGVAPDFESLRRIASLTGGRFATAAGARSLEQVYRDLGSTIFRVPERRELMPLFMGLATVLVLTGGGLSLLWFNRFP